MSTLSYSHKEIQDIEILSERDVPTLYRNNSSDEVHCRDLIIE